MGFLSHRPGFENSLTKSKHSVNFLAGVQLMMLPRSNFLSLVILIYTRVALQLQRLQIE